MSDYVLRNFDEDMLYYSFGNAVAMIMAGHVKITTVAAYMGSSLWTAVPQMKFKQYLHMADSTSDRGGLLACQSMAAAADAICWRWDFLWGCPGGCWLLPG